MGVPTTVYSFPRAQTQEVRVLLVDDEANIRRALKRVLRHRPYKIDEAPDGKSALQLLKQHSYTLIISDLRMPQMNGIELLATAAEIQPQTARILLTGQAELKDLDKAINQCSINQYIAKPWDSQTLLNTVDQVISDTVNLVSLRQEQSRLQEEITSAVELQRALLPAELKDHRIQASWIYQPCSQLGGDGFSYHLHDNHFSFYLIDVVGHGAGAAMESVALQHLLANSDLSDPAALCQKMNEGYIYRSNPMRYFTMLCGNIDLSTGLMTFCQAGHPNALLHAAGSEQPKSLGDGGFPIGLLEDVEFENTRFLLSPGDRLILSSDGFADQFENIIAEALNSHREDDLNVLRAAFEAWCHQMPVEDDISGLMLEYQPMCIH